MFILPDWRQFTTYDMKVTYIYMLHDTLDTVAVASA